MDNPVFGAGRGTPVIQDGNSPNMNNVTSSKQSVNSTTGLVVMASNDVTQRYWFADIALGSAPAPTASFNATPTSGTAPLAVSFTDTSTGSPTSWTWSFGDGTANSTAQNPSHTYTAAGTYTAQLTATNATGSTTATKTITVNPPAGTGITAGASTTTFTNTATTAVTLTKPTGVAAGDVLVASITADLDPTLTAPTGWTTIANALSIGSTSTAGARVFAYYHVVGASDPANYTWTLSKAVKWGAGVTAYRGVNTTTPLDSSVVTAVNTSGAGLDSGTAGLITQPSGWTQGWSAGGGQIAAAAHRIQATAGASGTAVWTLSSGRAIAGWRTALKPAG
jgi:PKD repeat protein